MFCWCVLQVGYRRHSRMTERRQVLQMQFRCEAGLMLCNWHLQLKRLSSALCGKRGSEMWRHDTRRWNVSASSWRIEWRTRRRAVVVHGAVGRADEEACSLRRLWRRRRRVGGHRRRKRHVSRHATRGRRRRIARYMTSRCMMACIVEGFVARSWPRDARCRAARDGSRASRGVERRMKLKSSRGAVIRN